MHAYHGNQSAHTIGPDVKQHVHNKCVFEQHEDTRDCQNFHGGHHGYTHRIVKFVDPTTGEGEYGQYFVTTVRETIARLISHYNDVTGFLSVVRCEHGGTLYCGPIYRNWCKEGTGYNFIAAMSLAARKRPNATSPCEPSLNVTDFALRWSMTSEQSWYILPLNRKNWAQNRTAAANAMRALLRRAYLQMGTASSELALSSLVTRMRYSLDTPWWPTTARESRSASAAAAAAAPAPPGMQKPHLVASEADLSTLVREQILAKHWSDVLLYQVTWEIEREQQHCYERLAKELREPRVQTTAHGQAVVSSAWWLPASQIDGVKRTLY